MHIVMIKLVSLEYRMSEDIHTLAYKRDVEEWLKQWTVANNFTPVCYAYEHITTEPITKADVQPMVDAAKDKLVAHHIKMLKRVFPEHTRIDRDYAEDFRFRFGVYVGESGEPLKYTPFA